MHQPATFRLYVSHRSISRAALAILALSTLLAVLPDAQAGVIMDNSLQLQSLTITPASGSASLSLTSYSFGYLANSNSEVMIGPCPIVVTGASFTCSTSTNPLTSVISGHVNTNNVGSVMGGVGTGAYGALTISGTGSPVLVNFHAIVPYSQILQSDIDIASSHLFISLYVGNQYLIQYASNYDLTRGQFVSDSGVLDFQSSLMLSPGSNYFNLVLSDGVRANPEPSTLWLFLGAIPMVPLHRFLQRRRTSSVGRDYSR